MNKQLSIKSFVLAAAIASGGTVFAAAASSPQASGSMPMHNRMMGQGMMDMMGSCQSMMDSGGMGMRMMPKFPPGNEKLEAEMHAEMMQKMGEIAARYAEKIKERP